MNPANEMFLDFPSVTGTREAATAFVAKLDAQIDEAVQQLEHLRTVRRATAALAGINRENGSAIKAAINGADRAHYEGKPS